MNSEEYLLKNSVKIPKLSSYENKHRLVSYASALFAIDKAKKEKVDDTEEVVLLQNIIDTLKGKLKREQSRCTSLRTILRKKWEVANDELLYNYE